MSLDDVIHVDEESRRSLLAVVLHFKAQASRRTHFHRALRLVKAHFGADLIAPERLKADGLKNVYAVHDPADRRLPMHRL